MVSTPSNPNLERQIRIKRIRTRICTVLIVIFCILSSVGYFGTQLNNYTTVTLSTPGVGLTIVGFLAGFGLAITTIWRHSWPNQIAAITAIPVIVLPMDSLATLIMISVASHQLRGKKLWINVILTTAATFAALWRDANSNLSIVKLAQSFGTPGAAERPEPAPLWLTILVTAIFLGIAIGIGFWRRTVDDLNIARHETVVHRANEERLNHEVSRQQERDEIAREVHDTLASRLSLLSLHSGALEVAASEGNPEVVDSARVVRDSAHQSLNDLRHLIGMLRESPNRDNAGQTAPQPGLTQLPELIDEARAAGSIINASLYLYDAASARQDISQAAYRIIQESLTNARKHAPDAPVTLDIRGGPSTGLLIKVSNPTPKEIQQTGLPGSGTGIRGMHERMQLVGGQIDAFLDNSGYFMVNAWMPWPPPASD